MIRTLPFAVAALLVWSGAALAQEESPAAHADGAGAAVDPADARLNAEFTIGPEDVLDISVWKNPELSRTVPVRPDGMVSLPLVNDIRAAGVTPRQLREQLSARLAEYIPAPEVSVIVQEVHSLKVSVVGQVRTPGRYELNSQATVLDVIAMAQGFTDFADRGDIVVLRQVDGVTRRIPFDYGRASRGRVEENFQVQPGDVVVVP